jgi:hypothetical protein
MVAASWTLHGAGKELLKRLQRIQRLQRLQLPVSNKNGGTGRTQEILRTSPAMEASPAPPAPPALPAPPASLAPPVKHDDGGKKLR